ncbi:hypothetical protein [Arenimonas sp.]|jgi:hypothetical protein|uniref:hypothetical protein n=1 Tax=Arenimonas sp. TaxID=1872635 RepID=UPI0037BE4CA0
MTAIRWAIIAFVVLMTGVVSAATPYVPLEQRLSTEQLRETGLDTLSAEQLKKLNAILADAPAQATAPVPVAPAVAAVAAPAAAASSSADRPLLGFNEKPIQGRLKGTLTGWEEGTVFTLDNGQQWKVLKGRMKLPKALTDPAVKLVPGIAGRWFLQVSEDYPMARVYLIN